MRIYVGTSFNPSNFGDTRDFIVFDPTKWTYHPQMMVMKTMNIRNIMKV